MKNFIKLFGIIALAAVIGFSMAACYFGGSDDPNGNENENNGGGSTTTNPKITIRNNTGFSISGIWIKPSNSTDWGSNLLGYSSLSDGGSKEYTFSKPLSTNSVYDILLSQGSIGGGYSGGYNFRKYGVTISNGMTITFTTSDLNDGSDLPTITILNRVGVSLNDCYIKPSTSSDWGRNFSSISNNDSRSVTIPIPPSRYTTFDIKTSSTNPNNTYTKTNVSISNGLVVIYTRADADNPLTGAPVIVIQNNTGFSIGGIWISPSTSSSWGSNLWNYSSLSDGELRTFELSLPMSSQYDIRLRQSASSGYIFLKNNVAVSDGMIITFTGSDLEQ
jgi:hypothetical protein